MWLSQRGALSDLLGLQRSTCWGLQITRTGSGSQTDTITSSGSEGQLNQKSKIHIFPITCIWFQVIYPFWLELQSLGDFEHGRSTFSWINWDFVWWALHVGTIFLTTGLHFINLWKEARIYPVLLITRDVNINGILPGWAVTLPLPCTSPSRKTKPENEKVTLSSYWPLFLSSSWCTH